MADSCLAILIEDIYVKTNGNELTEWQVDPHSILTGWHDVFLIIRLIEEQDGLVKDWLVVGILNEIHGRKTNFAQLIYQNL